MMHMTFYWGKNVTLLFDSWVTTTWTGYLLTLLAVFLVSALYQYLEDRRIKFKAVSLSKKEFSSSPPTIESPLLLGSVSRSRISARFVVAVLFGINSALGYMLMLAVMSFNWGVFLAVVFGLLVGYLVFRSDSVEDLTGVENPCACS